MGSSSDWETMQHAVDVLDKFGVPNEKHVMSAHRTPDVTSAFASGAQAKGLEVIIAGANAGRHSRRDVCDWESGCDQRRTLRDLDPREFTPGAEREAPSVSSRT